MKGCKLVDSTLEKLPVLPIYLSSGGYINSDEIIYLSDDYVEEGGLEKASDKAKEKIKITTPTAIL